MDYNNETRNAYRNVRKAREYHEQYSQGTKWARFTMWRQRALIRQLITECRLRSTDAILDIPCGTGFVGKILCASSARVVASDISSEMMTHALGEYGGGNFLGFVQSDITQTPFRRQSFDCVILLALMHRLPEDIRLKTWAEAIALSRRFIVVSYSVDSHLQKLKRWLIKQASPTYLPAPLSMSLKDIVREIELQGLAIAKVRYVAPLLSSKVILLTRRNDPTSHVPS